MLSKLGIEKLNKDCLSACYIEFRCPIHLFRREVVRNRDENDLVTFYGKHKQMY